MTSRALVLGGGGPVGFGWEIGMLKGLADQGIHLAKADLIVGTSAGAGVGSQLAAGVSPEELYEKQLQDVANVAPSAEITPDAEALGQIFNLWTGGSAMTQDVRAKIGALAANAKTGPEEEWTNSFNDRLLETSEWPEQRLIITAVDTSTGVFASWDRSSGVPLPLAIAASCSVPGIIPTVGINGGRYMDGGLRSVSNADLADGYDRVVVIAPSGAMDTPYDNNTRLQLEEEAQVLRDNSSTVAVVQPDAEALEASGPNRMDIAFLRPAAEAGLRQAERVGDKVRAVWQA